MLPPVSTARMMRVHHSARADMSTPHAALYPSAECKTHPSAHGDRRTSASVYAEPCPAVFCGIARFQFSTSVWSSAMPQGSAVIGRASCTIYPGSRRESESRPCAEGGGYRLGSFGLGEIRG
jgi:hypothetical protein